jgi:hypothetical protein
MATTTPNYGWTVPTSTDLVKDGATAIETLGDAIDASMNTALGTKKAGMVLLNTTSFSAVASQSFNDVFSANYDNYIIKGTFTNSAATDNALRFRVSGSDNSTNNYYWQQGTFSSTSITGSRGSGVSNVYIGSSNLGSIQVINLSILRPNLLVPAGIIGQATRETNFTAIAGNVIYGGLDKNTAMTGFSIIPSSGTITGTIYVYGENK